MALRGDINLRRKVIAMTKMRAIQITRAKGTFELVEREMPEPRAGEVRVRVQACGVCHSDSFSKDGLFPGIRYPIVPGHEIAGVIDAVGSNVPQQWAIGRRVGVGWFGGHCGYCEPCRRDDMIDCRRRSPASLRRGYHLQRSAPQRGRAR
jgi:D-arabinose 1-dehydrogenase-like Zn-dependent alcohol dehydrogenase